MFYSSVHRSETGRPRHGCNSLLICREATCEYVHSEIGLYTCVCVYVCVCVCVCVEGGGGVDFSVTFELLSPLNAV